MMNKALWDKIVAFDLEGPPAGYGFSIRLAKENNWTTAFTKLAILEYKKFMYMAATADFMVVPSAIVDIVWHQHLIFTRSYHAFCILAGRSIQHNPSTHSKNEAKQFRQASERTTDYYTAIFGAQPDSIWKYTDMYGSLHLNNATITYRAISRIAIVAIIFLTPVVYLLLNRVYTTIANPHFLIGFIGLIIVTFSGMESVNRKWLKRITTLFDEDSFIFKLRPAELIYLKTQQVPAIINSTINELIEREILSVLSDGTIRLIKKEKVTSLEEFQVISVLEEAEKLSYHALVRILVTKPVFRNTADCLTAVTKYISHSKQFTRLFMANTVVLATLFMPGAARMITGISRDKPVVYITLLVCALAIVATLYLRRLTTLAGTRTIPDLYRTTLLPTQSIDESGQWRYFLLGRGVFSTSFIALVSNAKKENGDAVYAAACGTSCGSSCGNGCGGCGS